MHRIRVFSLLVILCFGLTEACRYNDSSEIAKSKITNDSIEWCIDGVEEIRKGDILIIPNVNFFPGTKSIETGILYGHAALVSKGYKHKNVDSLLSNIMIIELTGLDIDPTFQLREVKGYVENNFVGLRSDSFSNKRAGIRYRLRLRLNEAQIDSIVSFARAQCGDEYCWNAMKMFPETYNEKDSLKLNWADNSYWNCTLLIWQAVFYVTGIDIDVNKGFFAYPNDIIQNPIFNNTETWVGRARF